MKVVGTEWYLDVITIYDLKPRFQRLLRPVCRSIVKVGCTANHITLLAVLLSAAAGAWIAVAEDWRIPLAVLPLILFLRMALNAIDGMMAREFDQKSRLGAILNELGDVVADALLYLPFALVPAVSGMLCVCAVMLGIIVEMTGVIAVQIGASRRYDGPFGKSDRAFAFGLLAILLSFELIPAPWPDYYLAALIALSCYTVFNRARAALAEGVDP